MGYIRTLSNYSISCYYYRKRLSIESRSDLSLSLKILDTYDQNETLQIFNILRHKPIFVHFINGSERFGNAISIKNEGILKGRNLINKLHRSNSKLSVKSRKRYKQSLK